MKIKIDATYSEYYFVRKNKGTFFSALFLRKDGNWQSKEEIQQDKDRILLDTRETYLQSPWYWYSKQEAEAFLIQTLTPEELAEYIAQKILQ